MGIGGCLLTWHVNNQRHTNLIGGEVGVVPPVVLLVLIIFLRMVSGYEDQRIVVHIQSTQFGNQLAYHLINLIGRVTV